MSSARTRGTASSPSSEDDDDGMTTTRTGDGLNDTAGPVPASTPEMRSSTK